MDAPALTLGFSKAPRDTRVVVAMSGGVDSSLTAALLARELWRGASQLPLLFAGDQTPINLGDVAAFSNAIDAVRANREESRYDLGTVAGRQQALRDLGYSPGPADGVWGPRSRGALIRFQRDRGLAADGIWGPATEAAVSGALRA